MRTRSGPVRFLSPHEVAAGAVDEPAEDAGAFFGDEDVGEVVDLAVVGDDAGEGDQAHAAPEGESAGADLGSVVAQEPELVGGLEAEEVLAHAAGLDAVSAGEELDAGLVELVPVLCHSDHRHTPTHPPHPQHPPTPNTPTTKRRPLTG